MKYRLALVLLFVWCGTTSAVAQTPPPAPPLVPAQPSAPSYPSVRVGGTLFTNYTYTDSPKSTDADGNTFSPSSFNVARSYINVTGNLSRAIAFRFTPDIAQEIGTGSSLNGSLTFRVKYAYLQTNLDKWTTPGSYARFGMQPTAFVNFSEDMYRYRFQGPVFVDREGFLSSSDAGAAFRYSLPSGYGDIHAGVYNGETYKKGEVNDQKALQIRGTVRPFAKSGSALRSLRLTGFYHGDHYAQDAERTRAVGTVSFEHKYLNTAFDYLSATDQTSARATPVEASGFSFWATPKSAKGWEGLFRIDRLTPDSTRDETKTRTIVGVSYWVPLQGNTSTVFLLDFEGVNYAHTLTPKPDERRVALHVLVNF